MTEPKNGSWPLVILRKLPWPLILAALPQLTFRVSHLQERALQQVSTTVFRLNEVVIEMKKPPEVFGGFFIGDAIAPPN